MAQDGAPVRMPETSAVWGQALEVAIAANVRSLRTARGLSITEFSEAVGLSRAMISKIENAQTSCSLATLERLASGLDVAASTLLEPVTPAGSASERGELIGLLGEVIRRLGGSVRP